MGSPATATPFLQVLTDGRFSPLHLTASRPIKGARMLLFVAFAAVSGADPERLTPVVVQLAALKSLEYALPGVALAWPARP